MQISKEQNGELNAVIKINVEPNDYQPLVDKVMKKYQHSATIPGFRPGKVPMGVIKKMYGKSVLVDELNNLLMKSLGNYIFENKIEIIGNPLPMKSEREQLFEEGQAFEFSYELGLTPKINVALSTKDKLPYYLVKVDDKMIDENIMDLRRRHGVYSTPETSAAEHILYGDFQELDETGAVKDDGNKTTTTVALEMIKDPIERQAFIGLKKDELVKFNPMKVFNHEGEVAAMLNLKKDIPALHSDYNFTIKSINNLEKAEVNQELFDKVYGEGTVTNDPEFRQKIKETIASYFEADSDHKLKKDLQHYLVEKLDITLPDDFLKRMLRANSEKEYTDAEFDHEYYHVVESLRWDLIKDHVAKEHNITVEEDELKDLARAVTRQQLSQYGIRDIAPERLEEFSARYLSEEQNRSKSERLILEDKVFKVLKTQVKLNIEELPYEEFIEKMKEKTAHELEHHH